MKDDKISSLMVPYGYYVRLMSKDSVKFDINAHYVQVRGDFYDRDGEVDCVNLSDPEYKFDNKVSSFIIYGEEHGYNAIGDWKKIETNDENGSFEYNTGTYYKRSGDRYSYDFKLDLKSGVWLQQKNSYSLTPISRHYAHSIQSEVKQLLK